MTTVTYATVTARPVKSECYYIEIINESQHGGASMRANHWLQFGSENLPIKGTEPQCNDPEIQKNSGGWVKTYVSPLGKFQTREQFFRSTKAIEYAWSAQYADRAITRGWDRAYLPN